ncbi:protein translocase subunit SecF [Actinotalea sp. AC32]|nr:protein translocase subunit SecF [Actinotalea sp. AC32]
MPSRMAQWGNDLYAGRRSYDIVGRRRRWFTASAVILLLTIVALLGRGLNGGIEFRGGTELVVEGVTEATQQPAVDAVERVVTEEVPRVSVLGGDSVRVQTLPLDDDEIAEVRTGLAAAYDVDEAAVSYSTVGPTWGQDVTSKALRALVIFLGLVALTMTMYFRDWRMAVASIVALLHDVVITVGLYALVGWEVTPATVIGFLTILGYSLYDTVVVFDKVRENTERVGEQHRYTYGELANLAVNQTLVRSINTSVVAVLPVASILFIGAFLLGAGTLRDIALALFIGIVVGTFSSIFVATPLLAWLKQRDPRSAAHEAEVRRRREAAVAVAETGPSTGSVRVGALVPGQHLGTRAQPRRRRPQSRPSGPGGRS